MSHFSVAVFTESGNEAEIERLLAPYYEGIELEPYVEFTRQQAIDYVRTHFDGMRDASDERCYELLAEDYRDSGRIDDDGNLLSTYNPESKWDWWSVGGRWNNALVQFDGKTCNCAAAQDVNFGIDDAAYRDAERFWEAYVDGGEEIRARDDFRAFYRRGYYVEQFGTKERYASMSASRRPYAFVTADGEWYETGKMGWWGVDDATADSRDAYASAFDAYLKIARAQHLFVTIIDCHI